ncbi:MAG: hypothetical protein ACTSR8_14470 [Promethearchaeota archaeon]
MNKRAVLLNIIFLLIAIFFIILSFTFGYFFFLPIFCFLPFTFRSNKRFLGFSDQLRDNQEFNEHKSQISYCPNCNKAIIVPDAKFCYHCSTKLK